MIKWNLVEFNEIDSTQDECKRRTAVSPNIGFAAVAHCQTKGRGRNDRVFVSEKDMGLYLSFVVKPDCDISYIPQLTAWIGVCAMKAVERLCGKAPDIKWPNDLQFEGKKLGGILCELEFDDKGNIKDVIVGVGVNLNQRYDDFNDELKAIATSLYMCTGQKISPMSLADAILDEIAVMLENFPFNPKEYLNIFRKHCVTLGKDVFLINGNSKKTAFAKDISDKFELIVIFGSKEEYISTGEVSIRNI